jgi:hypothetical protein
MAAAIAPPVFASFAPIGVPSNSHQIEKVAARGSRGRREVRRRFLFSWFGPDGA